MKLGRRQGSAIPDARTGARDRALRAYPLAINIVFYLMTH
jgi:hypothetical protein